MPTAKTKSTAPPLVLFGIGVSAGACAALFPRLMPLLFVRSDNVDVELLSIGYLGVVAVFSILVGVVMMWVYWGSKYKPQTLFMAALGVPSLLSGSLNMSNGINESTKAVAYLSQQYETDLESLQKLNGISEEIVNSTPKPDQRSHIDRWLPWSLLGISTAHAADGTVANYPNSAEMNFDPTVKLRVPAREQNYLVAISQSHDKADIDRQFRLYTERGMPDLSILIFNGQYYLVHGEQRAKSQALRDAIELKNEHQLSGIRLLQVR